jgi:hypothetical protein
VAKAVEQAGQLVVDERLEKLAKLNEQDLNESAFNALSEYL